MLSSAPRVHGLFAGFMLATVWQRQERTCGVVQCARTLQEMSLESATRIDPKRTSQVLIGLSDEDVAQRRAKGLTNETRLDGSRSYAMILFDNLFTVIHVILLVIAVALLWLGLPGDALVTAGLVVANVTVGVFQEARAKRTLDQVALLLRPEATVIREGVERTLDPSDIVLDDVLVVEPGDQFIVDGEIVGQSVVSVDESLLTGESDLITKQAGDPVYSGSFCMNGRAVYQATRVGSESTAQKMTASAREHRTVRTPLQREVGVVLQAMLLMAIVLLLQIILQFRSGDAGMPLTESVRASAVIFGLVPQGLVFMVTVTYAMAAVRLAGKGLLIQRMNAVESTSHINVLCLDKTGTLTTNQLNLHEVYPFKNDEEFARGALGRFVRSGSIRNRTADAIYDACEGEPAEVNDEVAFSSQHKWSAVTSHDPDFSGTWILGAPELLEPALREDSRLPDDINDWMAQGYRVLLFAWRPAVDSLYASNNEPRLPDDLLPVALLSFQDELRPEARETIEHFVAVGITPKIISGDHPATVSVLARQAGIEGAERALSGAELENLSDDEFRTAVNENLIFGRITPQLKERLVGALSDQGHYVAMIGDGVNDVLALKRSHIAIAMRSGSQVTRSVADLVLMDDSFGSLPRAFAEGQRILRGMQAIVRLFLTRGFYVALIILGASLLGYPFPSTPKLDTLLALLTIGIPILALAAWARPGAIEKRILRSAINFVVPAVVVTATYGLLLYLSAYNATDDVIFARTTLVTAMALCGMLLVPFVQPPHRFFAVVQPYDGDWRPTLVTASMSLLYTLIVAVPIAREFYEIEILPWSMYVLVVALTGVWLVALRWLWQQRLIMRYLKGSPS